MSSMASNWRMKIGAILNPTNPALPEEEQATPAAGDDTAPRKREPVLIVDDDAEWGNECAFSLQVLGYQPFLAQNAQSALDIFQSYDIAIAIVDYNMPGQDGISLLHDLSRMAEAEGRKLAFIVATGYATKDMAIDAIRVSAVDVLEKPFHCADLEKALQRAAALHALHDMPTVQDILLDKMSSLSAELQRVSHLMLGSGQAPLPPVPAPVSSAAPCEPGSHGKQELAAYIRELLKTESRRRAIGGGELFGDPAWEMLLDLLLADIEERRVSVSSACIASGAPMSTALRLVRRLVSENVLFKIPDATDRRRHFLVINPKFEQPLIDYLVQQLEHAAPFDRRQGSKPAADHSTPLLL